MMQMSDRSIQSVIEQWLSEIGMSCRQYLQRVVNKHTPIDGLFLWLSVFMSGCHINIVHVGGIWTSRLSEICVLTDTCIMLILKCFLYVP